MRTPRGTRASLFAVLASLGTLCAQSASQAATTFAGRVLEADGSPAAGTLVVTSAGGRAVTARNGSFELTITPPADAGGVQVTALGGASGPSRTASVLVTGLPPHGSVQVPLLQLQPSSTCQASWLPTFGSEPGASDAVQCFAVFDDGSGGGPALYVGGSLASAGDLPAVHAIARWDGTSWSAVGAGVTNLDGKDPSIRALAVFDDGSGGGPALYAGGSFQIAGAVPAVGIARWDGTSWSDVGGGVDTATQPGFASVSALAVFDDGGGAALYAGGSFTLAGGQPARRAARWNGSTWSALGTGMTGPNFTASILDLAVFDDGAGPALFASGTFTMADDLPANRIAKWNGAGWTALGAGLEGPFVTLTEGAALEVFDDGSGPGPALYVAGHFTTAGGVTVNNVAKWDGRNWFGLAGGMLVPLPATNASVEALAVFDDGSGAALYAGGYFHTAGGVPAEHVARWNGSGWSALGAGIAGVQSPFGVEAMLVHDDGSGPRLFVGGYFTSAGNAGAAHVTTWSASGWASLGGSGLNDAVFTAVEFDDGGGPALFVGGDFTHAGSVQLNHVAKWDGSQWAALGTGTSGTVFSLAVFDDGSGPALYAGGYFTVAGGVAVTHIARWDGASWSALSGTALNLAVRCLAVFDDGGGPALYAGGDFTTPASRIAKWTGASWVPLAGGITNGGMTSPDVEALTVYDDGSGGGPALYAAGLFFKAGSVFADSVARWNGASWSPLGSGLGGDNYHFAAALAVHDDGSGSGPELYAGGFFLTAGGSPSFCLAQWNGTSWATVGSGVNGYVGALAVHDDGSGGGPALFAGGSFTTADSMAANHLARWDGTSWSPLGGGTTESVVALASIADGRGAGPALIAGGYFANAVDSGDSFVARWAGCPPTPSPWTNLGYALKGVDGPPLLAGTGTLLPGTPGSITLTHAAPSAATILCISTASTPHPFKGGTLIPVPPSLLLSLATGPAGTLPLSFAAWPAGTSGLHVDFQYAIHDPAAIHAVALSNGLRADVP